MKKPEDIGEDDLRVIVGHLQDALYMTPSGYSRDYAPTGEDFAQLREIMDDLGLAPDGPEELERKAKHEEFAQFVHDLLTIIDGKFRLHDRGEAVKRLLAEFYLWSGGFMPGVTSFAERDSFLSGRELDRTLSLAMWPDAPERQVP